MKIYTRTGDTGETSLFDGTRVSKADPRVDAYGEVDELNAWLGLSSAPAIGRSPISTTRSSRIQRDLFALGASSPIPPTGSPRASTKAVVTDATSRGSSS